MGDKTTNYIFGELEGLWRYTNSMSADVHKAVKALTKSNKFLFAAVLVADAAVLITANEVGKLKIELEELKEKQGTMEC